MRLLIKSLAQDVKDSGTVLDEFEASHDTHERDRSKHYAALVAGHFALKEAIDKINDQLNKT